jgi:hypothetical protein
MRLPLVDPTFDLARQLKGFKPTESLLAAIKVPRYCRTDPQQPLLSWVVLTNHQLVFTGPQHYQSIPLPRLQDLRFHRGADGVSILSLKEGFRSFEWKGFWGNTEDALIRCLQWARTLQPRRAIHLKWIAWNGLLIVICLMGWGLTLTWLVR